MDLIKLIPKQKTEQEAYEAGHDAAINGSNDTNCHYAFFSSPAMTAAWEKGKRIGTELKNGKPKKAMPVSYLEKVQHQRTQVKALSWKIPFGALMLAGKIETRTWPTLYRGPVLICNSQKPYSDIEVQNIMIGNNTLNDEGVTKVKKLWALKRLAEEKVLKSKHGLKGKIDGFNLPGSAIAIGNLVDCRPMTKEDEDACFVGYAEPWQVKIPISGTHGHKIVDKQLWCHIYENVEPISPMAFKGGQKWTNVSNDFLQTLKPW